MAKTTESTQEQEQEQVQLESPIVDTTPKNTPDADNAAGGISTSEDGNKPEADNAQTGGDQFPVILSDPDLDALLNQVAEFRASHSELALITGAIAHDDSKQLYYIRIDKRQNYANT